MNLTPHTAIYMFKARPKFPGKGKDYRDHFIIAANSPEEAGRKAVEFCRKDDNYDLRTLTGAGPTEPLMYLGHDEPTVLEFD